MIASAIIHIVDDEERVRNSLSALLASHGLESRGFASVEAFVDATPDDRRPACLILDIQLPGVSGLEFQKLGLNSSQMPIIFLTGRGDIPSSVRAMKGGAVDFLTKPVDGDTLIAAVQTALDVDRGNVATAIAMESLLKRYASLSPREKDVLPLVTAGLMNKQAAGELGISETTLEVHRRRIMRKMAAANFADLVRMAARLQAARPRDPTGYQKDV
jgi:FixJ family two-component response regulator